MSDEEVLVSVEDGVASVTLNRPHRKNAITGPLADGLVDAFRAVSARDDVNVVLLSGAGGGFCSGLDLVEYNADPPPPWMSTATKSLVAAHLAIFDCPVPVVGALERFAINGGAAFALACDLVKLAVAVLPAWPKSEIVGIPWSGGATPPEEARPSGAPCTHPPLAVRVWGQTLCPVLGCR